MNLSSGLDILLQSLVTGLGAAIRAGNPSLDEETALRASRTAVDGRGLPQDIAAQLADKPVCTLVCFDADSIHSWVFDSERVQVAAGASETLDGLNQKVDDLIRDVPGLHGKLYSAGGGGMLFADGKTDVATLIESTREWLEARSHELTFTVIAEQLRAEDLKPGKKPENGDRTLGRFRHVDGLWGALVRAQVATRTAKDSRVRRAPRLVESKHGAVRAERCPSCGRRPPSREPVEDAGPEFWCKRCHNLRAHRKFEDANRMPITFGELAERIPRRRQYLGYVAVDGNSMGATVQSIGDLLGLRSFSEAVTEIYSQARDKVPAILESYLKDAKEPIKPEECYLSLLSGGDEITLVLPAAAAPEVALKVLKTIEEGFDSATSDGGLLYEAFQDSPEILNRLRKAGAAAGVITAHANYPVRLLRRYADELQKEAKRHCAESCQRSGLAWLLLTDSSPLTEGVEKVATSTDLDLSSFDRLLAEARAARDEELPSSALQGLLSYYRQEADSLKFLDKDRQVLELLAANFFRYQLARNEKLAAWWQAVQRIGPGIGATDGHDAVATWFQRGGGRRLEQLVDLLSLDPFPKAEAA